MDSCDFSIELVEGPESNLGYFLSQRSGQFPRKVNEIHADVLLAKVSRLISLAFAGSIGMTLVILACALPQYRLWWPFFVVVFYVLCPIPTMIARRHTDSTAGGNSPCMETAIFITMGLIVSSFGLPIVLAHVGTIQAGACYLTLAGNVIAYLTILGFFTIFDMEDSDYAMW